MHFYETVMKYHGKLYTVAFRNILLIKHTLESKISHGRCWSSLKVWMILKHM